MRLLLTLCLVAAAVATAQAQNPIPVQPFPVPYRSAAATQDMYALFYNPAGLGTTMDVEMGWLHHYTAHGPGGNNALMLRAKNVAGSISWIEDALRGNRREYLLGAGSPLSNSFFVGTTYRYLKADDSSLQNQHFWTHGILIKASRRLSLAAVWENPWHTKIDDVKTDGTIRSAVAVRPAGGLLDLAVDWTYPEHVRFDDTRLTWSVALHPARGIDINGFWGTDDTFGVELRLLIDRSAAGNHMRYHNPGGWQDGTFYVSVLQHSYPNAKIPERYPRLVP